MLLMSLAILVALTCVNFLMTRRLLHPSVVYSLIWAIQLVGLLLFSERFIKPSVDALFVVVLGAVSFTIGTYISSSCIFCQNYIIQSREVRKSAALFITSAVVVAICLYGQYHIFTTLLSGNVFADSLVYARTLMSIENEDIYGLYKYGSPIALGVLLVLQILIIRDEANVLHKILFGYFLIAALFMAVISTGRGPIAFIFLLLGLVYILSRDKKRIGWRAGGIFVGLSALVFFVFWIMGRVMGKVDNDALVALGGLVDYLFSSIPALSVYLDRNPIPLIGGDGGGNTLRFFSALAAAAGLVDKPANLVQGFVPVPHLTNLYTIYLQYVKDFGWFGVVLLPLMIGFLYNQLFLWSMSNTKNELAFYLLAISYLPLLQSVFQETHFSLMSSWIQFMIIGLVMTKTYVEKHRAPLHG